MNKKTSLFGLIAIAFIALTSCDKAKDALQADVNLTPNSVEFTIPEITTTDKQELSSAKDIPAVNFNQYKGVKSVRLHSLKIELLDKEPSANLKVLEEVEVEISNGSETIVLASATNNDFTTDRYSLEVTPKTEIDIQKFVKNSFSYKISGKAYDTTDKAVRAKISAVYTVKFGI